MNSYKYNVELTWIDPNNNTTIIDSDSISNITINHDYNNTMPIILIKINLNKELSDAIILYKSQASFLFNIRKYINNADGDIIFEEEYINGIYIYMLMEDINYNDLDFDETTKETKTQSDSTIYRQITIGMIKLDLINANKRLINTVYRNTTKTDIITCNTSHLNMIFEPIASEDDIVFDQMLIPPVTSVSELVKYLNTRSAIYPTPYRFYMDFDYTYLLSSSGNAIETKYSPINTIYLDIQLVNKGNYNYFAVTQGMETDNTTKTYNIPIDVRYTKMSCDNSKNHIYNRLIGFTTTGVVVNCDLDLNKPTDSNVRANLIKIPNENTPLMNSYKVLEELTNYTLRVIKSNIDASIFTLNKRYIVNNYDKYKDLNGVYIISGKQEMYKKDGSSFICDLVLDFQKV